MAGRLRMQGASYARPGRTYNHNHKDKKTVKRKTETIVVEGKLDDLMHQYLKKNEMEGIEIIAQGWWICIQELIQQRLKNKKRYSSQDIQSAVHIAQADLFAKIHVISCKFLDYDNKTKLEAFDALVMNTSQMVEALDIRSCD